MIECYLQGESLYTLTGEPLVPNELGMVEVKVNGQQKRFVADKFLAWLQKNHSVLPKPKQPAPVKVKPVKPLKKQRKRLAVVERDYKYQRLVTYVRSGISITAEKDGKTFGPFVSLRACSRALKISVSQVSKGLNGASCLGYKLSKNDGVQISMAGQVGGTKERTKTVYRQQEQKRQ